MGGCGCERACEQEHGTTSMPEDGVRLMARTVCTPVSGMTRPAPIGGGGGSVCSLP